MEPLFRITMVIATILMIGATRATEYELTGTVIRVVDGDTVNVRVTGWPLAIRNQSIRLIGIDTPESGGKARCEAERLKAEQARVFVAAWLPEGVKIRFVLDSSKKDKYNSRILSDIRYKRKTLSQALLAAGLAKPYNGGKKSSWCS